jgi:hypothetical protein
MGLSMSISLTWGMINHVKVTRKARSLKRRALTFPITMLLLTETILSHLDLLNQLDANAHSATVKGNYAGIGKVKDWAEKLSASKLLRPSLPSSTPHTRASSITTSTSLSRSSKVTKSTASSINPGPPPTPSNRVLDVPDSEDEDDLLVDREAAYNATRVAGIRRTTLAVCAFMLLYSFAC